MKFMGRHIDCIFFNSTGSKPFCESRTLLKKECIYTGIAPWKLQTCTNLTEFWRSQWHPTPVLLPGKAHVWRSLVGCSPWSLEESDTTERLDFYFSLSCIGEGNGNPLQCSYLENPRDGGAWWAAVYGVAQSRTWLKRLSSSSSSRVHLDSIATRKRGINMMFKAKFLRD